MKKALRTAAAFTLAALLVGCNSLPAPTPATEIAVPTTQSLLTEEGVLVRNWESGNRLLLLEHEGITVYLQKQSNNGTISYDIQFKNDSTQTVELSLHNACFNNRYPISGSYGIAAPGQWGDLLDPLPFPMAAAFGESEQVQCLRFLLKLSVSFTDPPLLEQEVQVNLSGTAALQTFYSDVDVRVTEPFRQFIAAERQILLEQDGLRLTLVGIGSAAGSKHLTCTYAMENTCDAPRSITIYGIALNDVFFDSIQSFLLQPGHIRYHSISLDGETCEMEAIGTARLAVYAGEKAPDATSPAPLTWCTVIPQAAANTCVPVAEGELLLEEQGLRISLLSQNPDYFGRPQWTLLVVNNTEVDLRLHHLEPALGDQQDSLTGISVRGYVGAHQRTIVTVTGSGEQSVSFRLQALDFHGNIPLFDTEGRITLTPP